MLFGFVLNRRSKFHSIAATALHTVMSFRRRKSLIFFLAITCCLVYYNWFYLSATDGSNGDADALLRRKLELNAGPRRDHILYAADLEINRNHEHQKVKDQPSVHHQRRDTDHVEDDGAEVIDPDDVAVISEKEMKHVSAVLRDHKAFLLDVDVLSRIHFIDKHLETLDSPAQVKAYKLNILETFTRLKQTDKKTPLITYGIYLDSLADLNDVGFFCPSPISTSD